MTMISGKKFGNILIIINYYQIDNDYWVPTTYQVYTKLLYTDFVIWFTSKRINKNYFYNILQMK